MPRSQSETTDPVWEVATLYPDQGDWSPEDYLRLSASTNRLIEYTDGRLEFLPMPTKPHQRMLRFLFELLAAFVESRQLGEVFFSPMRVRLAPRKYREPDIVFVAADRPQSESDYCDGADLVVEVVSEEGRKRDLEEKRRDYAEAGVPEYWIVDPREQRIVVLKLKARRYVQHGAFDRQQIATSALLPGFKADVSAVLDAAGSRQ